MSNSTNTTTTTSLAASSSTTEAVSTLLSTLMATTTTYINDTNNTNTTAPGPHGDTDALDGVCTKFNTSFLIILITASVSLIYIIVLTILKQGKPTKGVVSYGQPYHVMCLFAELAFWNTVAQAVLFIIFKVLSDDLLPNTSAMACVVAGSGLPFLPFYFLLMAFAFVFLSNNGATRETVHTLLMKHVRSVQSEYIYNNHEEKARNSQEVLMTPAEGEENINTAGNEQQQNTSSSSNGKAPRILVVGALQRGTVFAEFRKSVLQKNPNSKVVNLDFAGLSDHIKNNVLALGACDNESEIDQIVVSPPEFCEGDVAQFNLRQKEHDQDAEAKKKEEGAGGNNNNNNDAQVLIVKGGSLPAYFDTGRLGLERESFDEIVILPYVRNQAPMGGFLTSEPTKMLRMVDMLRSVSNTLRPGGFLTCIDVFGSGVLVERDLHDTGIYDNIKLEVDAQTKMGPTGFSSETVSIKAHKKSYDAVSRARIAADDNVAFTSMEQVSGTYLSPASKVTFISIVQCAVFFVLLFIAASLFHPLDVPTLVPLSARVGNIVVSVATNYVMIAYLARQALTEEVPMSGVGMLVGTVLKADLKVIVVSLLFTILFWLPTFLLQIALAETSLNDNTKSIIGTVISIYLGIFGYKRGRKMGTIKTLKSRGVSDAYIAKLTDKK